MHPTRRGTRWMMLGVACIAFAAGKANATRVGDLCEIQGARGNALKGVGLVVGLAGTGDKAADAVLRQERMLDRLEVDIIDTESLSGNNVAVVVVTTVFPAFAKEGTRIDVQVNSIYDCESLEGGTLLETHLIGADGNVYAVAQGSVSVGGFNASGGGGTSVTQNHVTAGRVPMGAYIEREIPSSITDGERITLLLKNPEFRTANQIREALDTAFGGHVAQAYGAGAISVRIPQELRHDLVSFIANLEDLNVDVPQTRAKVVVNERTGTIVVGGNVTIKPCQIAHGSLSISVATTPLASQPNPFAQGQTVVSQVSQVTVTEPEARLMPVEAPSAADVAIALNKLKVTPRDLIAIFQALRQAGALEADLEIM